MCDTTSAYVQKHVLVRLDTEHILSTTLKVGNYFVYPADKLSSLLFLLKGESCLTHCIRLDQIRLD